MSDLPRPHQTCEAALSGPQCRGKGRGLAFSPAVQVTSIESQGRRQPVGSEGAPPCSPFPHRFRPPALLPLSPLRRRGSRERERLIPGFKTMLKSRLGLWIHRPRAAAKVATTKASSWDRKLDFLSLVRKSRPRGNTLPPHTGRVTSLRALCWELGGRGRAQEQPPSPTLRKGEFREAGS